MTLIACIALFAALANGESLIPQGANVSPNGDRLDVTSKCLRLNGRPIVPVMGEMHYSRVPRSEWARSLATMKEGGISIVSTYVFWNHHEWTEDVWDFSGNRDLSAFLGEVKRAGLWAVVRIGPWDHGECREGGFPDWLIDKAYGWAGGDAKRVRAILRSRDARFMAETEKLFRRIHHEVAPHFWKNGGAVVGIQLENESRGPWAYYQALKKLALDIGYDVPMFTRTGWPKLNGPETTFGEMIPLYGDYAEGFWDRSLKSMPGGYKDAFAMRPARTSSVIATEQLGAQKAEDTNGAASYPYFTCELGGGMVSSYHRRLVTEPMDAFSIGVVKLGSGSNMPGYYMYHGGSNPVDLGVNMAESQRGRFTNYNDLPVVSYEFLAPVSEFGEPQHAYWMVKALADFCRENAEELAVADPVFVSRHETRRGRFIFHNEYVRRINPGGECWVGVEKDGKTERIIDGKTLAKKAMPHAARRRMDVSNLRLVKPAGTPPPVAVGPSGVAVMPDESAWDAAAVYSVPVENGDTMLEISYEGDMARLYADGKLVQDDFWKGLPIRYALRRLPEGTTALMLKVLPWGAGAREKIFVDRTFSLQEEIDAVAASGGGRVTVPAGEHLSDGPLRLRSNVELHLEDGARIVFSDDPAKYLPAVPTSWEGVECLNYSPLVYAYGCTNVAITGKGTFAPKMGFWRRWFGRGNGHREATRRLYDWCSFNVPLSDRDLTRLPESNVRPHLIQFNRCKDVRLEGFKIRESPFWTIHLYLCDGVVVRGLDVYAHGHNNDGIDIDMTRNVLVEDCRFDQGDDAIVIKSGRNQDAWRLACPSENIEVRNCTVVNGHVLLGVGSEVSGGVRNVSMHDCSLEGEAFRLFYVKTNERRGGFVENIRMENVKAKKVRFGVMSVETDVLYQWKDFPTHEVRVTPIKNLVMRNVEVEEAERLVHVCGDARRPVDGVTLENVRAGKVLKADSMQNAVNVSVNTSAGSATTAAVRTFEVGERDFLLDGKPFVVRCGEIHYARIPRAYWRHRLQMLRAMGCNAVGCYMFWNFHEREKGVFKWDGRADAAEFCRMAQAEGLWVILRPGPYSCAEWEGGGAPWWLMRDEGKGKPISMRSSDPRWVVPATNWLHAVGRELAGLQVTKGGPILMVQVENEYGLHGSDVAYMRTLRQAVIDAGFEVPLYACNPPRVIQNGFIPELFQAANFGAEPEQRFAIVRQYQPKGPLMCAEYYPAWFDTWGQEHHYAKSDSEFFGPIDWMFDHNASFSLYMAHGGTSFGGWVGCRNPFIPNVTSYDFEAPISENGRANPSFAKYRERAAKHLNPGETIPAPPADMPSKAYGRVAMERVAPVDVLARRSVKTERPEFMERMGQGFGLVSYERFIEPGDGGRLNVDELHDFGYVLLDGKRIGILDRRHRGTRPRIYRSKENRPRLLQIVVEAMGRINSSSGMEDRKGMSGRVRLDMRELTGWTARMMPLDPDGEVFDVGKWRKGGDATHEGTVSEDVPALYVGTLSVPDDVPADTFLDMKNWTKGVVWVNGRNLGRFWSIGPQQTLYVPGCWLKKGGNDIVVLDFIGPQAKRDAEFVGKAVLDVLQPDTDFNRKQRRNEKSIGGAEVASGTFPPGDEAQVVMFEKGVRGNFFTLQALATYDRKNLATISEFAFLDKDGNPMNSLDVQITGVDSEDEIREDGVAENAVDGQVETFWLTSSRTLPHWIEFYVQAKAEIHGFRYTPRQNANIGRIKDWKFCAR